MSSVWLYAAAGTPVHAARGRLVETLQAQAVLVPDDKPWVAAWRQDGSTIANVTTPPLVQAMSVRYVDLGLAASIDENGGVDRHQGGALDRAVGTGRLAAEQAAAARAALAELEHQMTEGVEPLGQMGREWLAGITRNELHFVAYDPEWPSRFNAAREEILPLLPTGSRVEHFGSTAVPGLAAKDCIDIAAVVPRLSQIGAAITALTQLGYEARPKAFNDPGHVLLRRLRNGRRSHHLHLYQEGHQNLIEVLAFRDLLRTDPGARGRYQSVKESLAEANPYDRGGYLAGKNEVVQELLQLALARFRDRAASDPAHGPSD